MSTSYTEDRPRPPHRLGASRTAELMAVQRGLESRHPAEARLFSDPFATAFVSPGWRAALAVARVDPARRVIERVYDRIGGPGPRASAVARTRLIDDLIIEAAAAAEQVVILGAGFDVRGWRLPALARSRIFEVDRGPTQALKRARLQRRGALAGPAVTFVPVDFERDELAAALREAGYDEERRSIFVWEGVTNYLTADAVEQTLVTIRHLAHPGSTLIFTYVDRAALGPDGAQAFPEATRWLEGVRRRGEPWTFGLVPSALGDELARHGWTLASDQSTAEAGERYFPSRHRRERGSALYHVATATVTGH